MDKFDKFFYFCACLALLTGFVAFAFLIVYVCLELF